MLRMGDLPDHLCERGFKVAGFLGGAPGAGGGGGRGAIAAGVGGVGAPGAVRLSDAT